MPTVAGKWFQIAAVLLCAAAAGMAQNSSPATAPPAPVAPPQQAEPQQPQNPPSQDAQGGGFVFKAEVQEVVLHAVVVDQSNHLVTTLRRENFSVLEDGKPQKLTFFRQEDVPVALGILVDNSGSMRPKRAKLSEAALKLVEGSRTQDSVFVVNFGDQPYLDQDFTSDVGKLRAALNRTETQGSTALYDAVVASAEHLEKGAVHQKKVLLVITDGQDNTSQDTLNEALHQLETKNGPVVYAIALQAGGSIPERRDAIQALCERTGGAAFFPDSLENVRSIAETIARDIRSQYVLGYKSSNPEQPGAYHAIVAHASAAPGDLLRVSTRAGYYTDASGNIQ
jgi:VWFA-related protein